MTRKLTLIALAVAGSLFIAGSALAATGTAQASVNIVAPLTVTNVQDMDFGTIAPPSTGTGPEVFTLSTAGVVSEGTGDGSHFTGGQAAQFTVAGTNGQSVSVNPTVTTDFADGGLTLGSLQADVGATLDLSGGADEINIGGALSVSDTAVAGSGHVATIQLEVLYQ